MRGGSHLHRPSGWHRPCRLALKSGGGSSGLLFLYDGIGYRQETLMGGDGQIQRASAQLRIGTVEEIHCPARTQCIDGQFQNIALTGGGLAGQDRAGGAFAKMISHDRKCERIARFLAVSGGGPRFGLCIPPWLCIPPLPAMLRQRRTFGHGGAAFPVRGPRSRIADQAGRTRAAISGGSLPL